MEKRQEEDFVVYVMATAEFVISRVDEAVLAVMALAKAYFPDGSSFEIRDCVFSSGTVRIHAGMVSMSYKGERRDTCVYYQREIIIK